MFAADAANSVTGNREVVRTPQTKQVYQSRPAVRFFRTVGEVALVTLSLAIIVFAIISLHLGIYAFTHADQPIFGDLLKLIW